MATLKVTRKAGEIENLSQLRCRVDQARNESPTGAVWLRGMSKECYLLVPSVGREHRFAGKTKTIDLVLERELLHRFRRHAFEYFGRKLTEWEALIVARHHGLPVRLLDWTADLLAALYFACEFKSHKEVSNSIIWLLIPNQNVNQRIDVFEQCSSPFDVKGIRLVYPMAVAARINAQSGLFTIQSEPSKALDKIDVSIYGDRDIDVRKVIEFTVPAQCRAHILKDLNDLQVTRRTLFPDLDGLSAGMMSAEILRGPKGELALSRNDSTRISND